MQSACVAGCITDARDCHEGTMGTLRDSVRRGPNDAPASHIGVKFLNGVDRSALLAQHVMDGAKVKIEF
jgi:hypothetical protein